MTQRTIRNPLSPAKPFGAELKGNKAAKSVLEKTVIKAMPKISELPNRKAKLHYVADMIEAQALVEKGVRFNMAHWKSDISYDRSQDQTGASCGTVACIAGWTMLLEKGVDHPDRHIHGDAQELLGLTEEEAQMLFLGEDEYGGDVCELEDVTLEQAVSVIRDFADNGKVRWAEFAPAIEED